VKSLFLSSLLLLSGVFGMCAVITAVQNGNWTNNNTWDLVRAPQNADVVIIPAGITVYFQNSPYPKNDVDARPMLDIRISGSLDFSNAGNDKMYLDQGSTIQIFSGGKIETEHPSPEIIAIYNGTSDNTVWNGSPSTLDGPKSATGTSVGFTNVLLPLVLQSFNLEKIDKSTVRLTWITAAEVNTLAFEIQKSTSGSSIWVVVGKLKAAGESSETLLYEFNTSLTEGLNLYRLKMIDRDGQFSFSPVIRITGAQENSIRYIPSDRTLRISTAQAASISIFDMSGRKTAVRRASGGVVHVSPSLHGLHIVAVYIGNNVVASGRFVF
jgi:hypothetical protein